MTQTSLASQHTCSEKSVVLWVTDMEVSRVIRTMIVAEGAMATIEILSKTQNMTILENCAKTLYMLSLYDENAPVIVQQGLSTIMSLFGFRSLGPIR